MTVANIIVVVLLLVGFGLSGIGTVKFFVARSNPLSINKQTDGLAATGSDSRIWLTAGALIFIIGVAFVLRIEGLALRSMSHVEVYVPGIVLPDEISEPPPRIGIKETILWHWHKEPHPQGYYFLGWVWTKIFGTDLRTLRFPSVLFGTGAVFLIYLLAAKLFGRPVGLISAALLALNGHQIYWSQTARMYEMATFLSLLSTLLLTQLLDGSERKKIKEISYAAVTWLGLFTQIFFWPFLAAQMLFAAWFSKGVKGQIPRLLKIQTIVAIFGAPLWTHAVYLSREIELGHPSITFAQQFLNFGFLLQPNSPEYNTGDVSSYITIPLTVIAILALATGLRANSDRVALGKAEMESDRLGSIIPISIGFVLIILGLSLGSWKRQEYMAITACVPILALLIVPLMGRPLNGIQQFCASRLASNLWPSPGVSLMLISCFVPSILLFMVAFVKPLLIDRGFLFLSPYLIVLLALGLNKLVRRKVLFIPIAVFVISIHAYSYLFYRAVPDANDYRSIAQQMIAKMKPNDRIFVPKKSWVSTPLFYDLIGYHDRLVAENYAEALKQNPDARVWLPLFSDQMPSTEMAMSLGCFYEIDQVESHNSRALLLVRKGGDTNSRCAETFWVEPWWLDTDQI